MSHHHRQPPESRPPASPDAESGPSDRLQKVLAAAGLGSRRYCEELIVAGRVEVDRQVVTHLGTKVDRRHQEIRVDGVPLARPKKAYYLVHKPPGVVSTSRDPAGRPRVIDLLPPVHERLFTVGRLDLSSEGLILVTNDGELAHRLTHPRYGVEKTYLVTVAGQPEREVLGSLLKGVHLAEGFARVARLRVKTRHKKSTVLEIVLNEGRNREIRRLLARVGHKVVRLVRIALGPVRLGEMPQGAYRPLSHEELRALHHEVEANRRGRRGRRKLDAPTSRPQTARQEPRAPENARPPKPPRAGRGAKQPEFVFGGRKVGRVLGADEAVSQEPRTPKTARQERRPLGARASRPQAAEQELRPPKAVRPPKKTVRREPHPSGKARPPKKKPRPKNKIRKGAHASARRTKGRQR